MRLLIHETGRTFYVKDISKDYHTQFGFVKQSDLKKKAGSTVKTNTGKELTLMDPSFIDLYQRIRRAPQIIPRKDIGFIIAETGVQKNWNIVDAGSGSGALCIYLSQYCKKVTSYEIRPDFQEIVKANIDFFGITNLTIKNKDIYKGISEKNLDMITLDLPEPWLVVKPAETALKSGGFLVSYSPTVPQMMDFVTELKKFSTFIYMKSIEVQVREWEVEKRRVRPKSVGIAHSGFISFARRR